MILSEGFCFYFVISIVIIDIGFVKENVMMINEVIIGGWEIFIRFNIEGIFVEIYVGI